MQNDDGEEPERELEGAAGEVERHARATRQRANDSLQRVAADCGN